MIKVYKSDSGQFVLVHAPSQTFIIDEDLESGYAKLEAHIAEHHPEHVGQVTEPMDTPAAKRPDKGRTAQLVLFVFLALLPFVWLLVMHYSLATLMTELRFAAPAPAQDAASVTALQDEVDELRLEQNRLLEVLYHLNQRLGGETESVEPAAPEEAPAETDPDKRKFELQTPPDATTDAAEAAARPAAE